MATTFASPPQRILPDATAAPEPLWKESRPNSRYTVDGSEDLEARLQRSSELIKETLLAALPPDSIEGLLLGGGYGRGEGGVLRDSEGDHPYNDLEFYLFVRGDRHLFDHRFGDILRRLSHDIASAAGIEIELKVLTFSALHRAPISMFFYDMIVGHKWLIGSVELLRCCEHHRAAHLLPVSEATRLLMNRCSGLLFAREQLAAQPFTAENADFIRRNIRKAQLAFGDAVLATFGRYHWSCRERHQRLRNFTVPLPWRADLLDHHRYGIEFKLHPFRSRESREQLEGDLNGVIALAGELWLWLESRRLRHSFISPRHYATSPRPKWPDTNSVRNALLNLKLFRGPLLRDAFRHPRERILESLALLLWEPLALSDSSLRNLLSSNLRAQVTDRSATVQRYRQLWSLVS